MEDAITLLVAVPLSQRALAMIEQPTIIIVDDDAEIREALVSLIRSVGVQTKALASVPEFLNEGRPEGPTCLVLDVRLRAEAVSIFSESSRRRTSTFRSSSSPDMATSQCPCRR
jgi:ActR/RegA family two-component response regulator